MLTKNWITFKKWDGVKDGKFWYYGISLKNQIFRGWVNEKSKYRGDCLKRGGLGQFADLKGGMVKKKVWCFWGGLIPQCTPEKNMFLKKKHWKTFKQGLKEYTHSENILQCVSSNEISSNIIKSWIIFQHSWN